MGQACGCIPKAPQACHVGPRRKSQMDAYFEAKFPKQHAEIEEKKRRASSNLEQYRAPEPQYVEKEKTMFARPEGSEPGVLEQRAIDARRKSIQDGFAQPWKKAAAKSRRNSMSAASQQVTQPAPKRKPRRSSIG